ncbi:MAG: helix-turn-helix domain-containing protein [Xanthobacteraceae bacterium]
MTQRVRRPLFPICLTTAELSTALRIERRVVYEALKAGELTAYRKGLRRVILVTDAIAWIKQTWKRG